jgi:K+-sensing histidine kinase KdpD
MKLFSKISFFSDTAQMMYALIVVVLVPLALAFNTLYLLNSIQRDMDYELNNKALLVESAIALALRDSLEDQEALQKKCKSLIEKLPEIRALEVFRMENDDISSLTSTSSVTKSVTDPALNQLAWGTNKPYSKQIYLLSETEGKQERVWLVSAPIHDVYGKKVALLNLYLSAAQIDAISERTIQDSLMVMVVTMIIVILLLLNHFRFFEISILFKKLRDVDRVKDDFISIASHELKTPLTAISGYASLLQKNQTINSDPALKKDVNIIMESINRFKAIVEDILDVSRIEQNRISLKTADISIKKVIEETVNEYSSFAQKKISVLSINRRRKNSLSMQILISCIRYSQTS